MNIEPGRQEDRLPTPEELPALIEEILPGYRASTVDSSETSLLVFIHPRDNSYHGYLLRYSRNEESCSYKTYLETEQQVMIRYEYSPNRGFHWHNESLNNGWTELSLPTDSLKLARLVAKKHLRIHPPITTHRDLLTHAVFESAEYFH